MSSHLWPIPSEMLITLENIQKSYPLGRTRVPALRGVNLTVTQGDFMGLVGTSGSGKSTLLNILGCLDRADSGRYLLSGRDITTLSEQERSTLRNREIGFVFQSFNLIPVLSVLDNVALPLHIWPELSPEARDKRARSSLDSVGLENFATQKPDQLSGGQRQRVALARALVTDAKIILADEPTANLDSKTAHQIIDLLIELNQKRGKTFLFCTHDEKLIKRVSKIAHISDGLIQTT